MFRLPNRLKDETGFALAMAIFALVLLAAIIAGGYFSASQEYQIGRSMRTVTTSFYSGESGIYEVLDDWDPRVYFALAPGETLSIAPTVFEGGGSYSATVVRVGRAADVEKRYFYIEAVGRPPGSGLGERRQAMIVRARYPDFCCDYAMRVYDIIDFSGGGQERIYGTDRNPPGWPSSVCDEFSFGDTAGVFIRDPSAITNPSLIVGSPPVVTDYPAVGEGVIFFPGYNWNDLVSLADHDIPGGYTGNSTPSYHANGECDTSDPYNWGAPDSPGDPCFDYFPVIHVNGTITITNGSGQGIFLIENELHMIGPADFFGIALIRNDFVHQGPSAFYGMAWVADDIEFQGTIPRVYLSRCAAERAILESSLTSPRPVRPRSWVELF